MSSLFYVPYFLMFWTDAVFYIDFFKLPGNKIFITNKS